MYVHVCLRIVSYLATKNLTTIFYHLVVKWRLEDFFNFKPCTSRVHTGPGKPGKSWNFIVAFGKRLLVLERNV